MPAMIPYALKDKDLVIGTNLYKVEINDKSFSNEYIYWLLKTKRYVKYIAGVKTGTTVSMVTKKNVEDFTFLAPVDPGERDQLVSVISHLDDKIDVNRRICEILEAQAKALFKYWFIDFEPFKNGKFVESELGMIPEKLIYKKIEEMPHTLETGKRPSGGVKGIESGVPSIGAENIKGLGCYDYSKTKYVTEKFASTMKKGKIKGYELLIYKDGGKPGYFIPNFAIFGDGYPFDEMCLNEHVFKLDFGNKGYSLFAYFFFKTKQIMSYLNAQGAKAAIPGINSKDIESIMMPSLENECVLNYCDKVENIITHILTLSKESARLATLRDTLLPKLMSGQITL
jgi:type I restriction enzyme S subunit